MANLVTRLISDSFLCYHSAELLLCFLFVVKGYILHVNGKWSAAVLPPEQQETKLTGFSPGDVIRVQLAAVTGDLVGPISDVDKQGGNTSRCFRPSYEPPDSGVESSSSFLSTYSTTQFSRSVGPPLVIQFSNFVKKVSSLEVINAGCWSALITWSLDDTADRCVEPEVLSLSCWKATEQEESAVKHVVRGKDWVNYNLTRICPTTNY